MTADASSEVVGLGLLLPYRFSVVHFYGGIAIFAPEKLSQIHIVNMKPIRAILLVLTLLSWVGIATLRAQEPTRVIAQQGVEQQPIQRKGLKWKVAVGRFSNETYYGKGIFYNRANDPMAKQALDILVAKLSASGKFILLERSDMDKIAAELRDIPQQKVGADYLILGSITEYGRKIVGKEGFFTSEKKQIVEAGVSIRIVDVSTGLVIYSEEAKGRAETSSRSTLGMGGRAGYDATLSDKAISGAIDQLVENIINKCTDRPWRTYVINADEDGVILAGGATQGIKVGDTFTVYKRGKKVTNPQTGTTFELAGKPVAQVRVQSLAGDTPETEYAIVEFVSGSLDNKALDSYYVQP